MKTILMSIMLLSSILGSAKEPSSNAPSETTLKQVMAKEIEAQLCYPELKLSYMDALEAKIFFVLNEHQQIEVVHISSSNQELAEQLRLNLGVATRTELAGDQKVYSIRVHFN